MDAGSIPAISTNNKGQPFFRLAFFIGGFGVEASPLTGSTKLSGAI